MAAPVVIAVDDEAESLATVERELRKRYGGDYEVVCEQEADRALETVRSLKDAGRSVAVVLADQWMPQMTGVELLAAVRDLYPEAKGGC